MAAGSLGGVGVITGLSVVGRGHAATVATILARAAGGRTVGAGVAILARLAYAISGHGNLPPVLDGENTFFCPPLAPAISINGPVRPGKLL
jgi:hypothetical protein